MGQGGEKSHKVTIVGSWSLVLLGVAARISAKLACVSLPRGEGAGVFVHQLLSITGGGCSSRERAGGQKEPWGRERWVLAAGRPECTERVRLA